jgi:membrane-associated phospholipid phosphatase
VSRALLGWSALAAVAVFVLSWVGWEAGWPWLTRLDDTALDAAHRAGTAHPAWVTFWNVLCTVLSPLVFRVIAAGLVIWAAMRREWVTAAFLANGVLLSGPVTELFKFLSDRPRPSTAMVSASSTSFPSGHAFGTTAAVLVLLAWGLPLLRRTWWPWLIGVGLVAIIAVGVGRVALNVHHPSDVVAGWALGWAWFVGCLWLRSAMVRQGVGRPAVRDSPP